MSAPRVLRVNGALVEAGPVRDASLFELARVGELGLLGEVVALQDDIATVQVYEETTGLRIGSPVALSGGSLTVELGPGLLGSVFDGVGRPLERMALTGGDFIQPGAVAPTLDPDRRWRLRLRAQVGDDVAAGDVLGEVEEAPGLQHKVLLPPGRSGRIRRISDGDFAVHEPFGELEDGSPLLLAHAWPIRRSRPPGRRLPAERPYLTGQRVFDFLFPVAEGGSVAVPGGFGTGKTVIEQALAKYGEADIVIFVGCGERGNEMADVVREFSRLTDPDSGRPLMERTILVVNTSNMPVAAREASIYLGLTLAEFYRDMGHRVAVMVDSLSRWAEALREISGRMQEMPGEEGFPTYLASRLGAAYERAGRVEAQGRPERVGSLTLVSAVSPPGGDFSEPVTQASLRVAGALWALDAELAHQRQFPAVDWTASYSLYSDATVAWFAREAGEDWEKLRGETLRLLESDAELREIAGLIGQDALQDADRLALEVAAIVREAVLSQNAFDPNDAFSPVAKTYGLARLARDLLHAGRRALEAGTPFEELDLESPRRALIALRDATEEERSQLEREASEAVGRIQFEGGAT
jgi:V/A-type H+-transporting ATPase subunit A